MNTSKRFYHYHLNSYRDLHVSSFLLLREVFCQTIVEVTTNRTRSILFSTVNIAEMEYGSELNLYVHYYCPRLRDRQRNISTRHYHRQGSSIDNCYSMMIFLLYPTNVFDHHLCIWLRRMFDL
jgi:hypothetical protein